MTKHASVRNAHVTRTKFNRYGSGGLHSNFKNPWIADQYTNTVSSSVSSQGVAATYCTIDGSGGQIYRPNGTTTNNHNSTSKRNYVHNTLSRNNNHIIKQSQPQQIFTAQHTVPRNVKYGAAASVITYSSNPNSIFTYKAHHQRAGTTDRLLHAGGAANALNSGRCISNASSDRPITPVSISTVDGVIDPCGGHCRAFERCCHYFLQVVFVIGILTGVSLVLAGYIFHGQKRGSDLLVLVYIGVLMAMVCTLLLSIQCSAQRDVKRRKRRRNASAIAVRNRIPAAAEVPLREFRSNSYPSRNNTDFVYNSQYPYRVTATKSHTSHTPTDTNMDVPCCDSPLIHESSSPSDSHLKSFDEMSQSQNGIPWWRREETQVTLKYSNNIV